MAHDLIPLTQWPAMPAPFNSSGPGEAWVWGDYVLLLQTNPGRVADLLSHMVGQAAITPSPLSYPFVISVFYRRDRNPHGPSSQPILVVGLEKVDYKAVALMMKARDLEVGELGLEGESGVPMIGVFTASKRLNLGCYEGPLTLEDSREHLMSVIADHLSPHGEAVKIGPIAAIHGHPDTGWPAQSLSASAMSAPRNKKRGCLVFTGGTFVCVLALLVMSMGAWLAWAD